MKVFPEKHQFILGGGASGTALAFFLMENKSSFSLFEKNIKLGGNARTIEWRGHLYDTGAHRLHDQIPQITELFKSILEEDWHVVEAPSQIIWRGERLSFPLKAFELIQKMPIIELLQAFWDWNWNRHFVRENPGFASLAIKAYGKKIAKEFLLNYTEKLWGKSSHVLHPSVAGKRLKGLGIRTILFELLGIEKKKQRHLDGQFFYPKYGIGQLFQKMQERIQKDLLEESSIELQSSIDEVSWEPSPNGNKITSIKINGIEVAVSHDQQVWNTLPISLLIQKLNPQPPEAVVEATQKMEFRHLALVIVQLSKSKISDNASLYFADSKVPFNRLYEPSNRSKKMSPQNETLAVLEIGISEEDIGSLDQSKVITDSLVSARSLGLWTASEEKNVKMDVIPFAYPIPLLNTMDDFLVIEDWLSQINNLYWVGRGAEFKYTHIHDHFQRAKELLTYQE